MNLLLVDDDVPVLQDLQQKLNWHALGFERVFTAQSAFEASRLLGQLPVHIVVCDIEMPGRNGLDFLAELHMEHPELPCIVLTSYARFEYAQKAVQIGIVEYLLKPVDASAFEAAVRKAINLYEQHTQANAERRYSQYWLDEQRNASEYFWLKTASSSTAGLHGLSEKLGYTPDTLFIPVIIEALTSVSLSGWDASMLEYAVKNICYEFLENEYLFPHCVVQFANRRWLAIISVTQGPATDSAPLDERLAELCLVAQDTIQLNICCGVGIASPYTQMQETIQDVLTLLNDRIDRAGCVLHTGDIRPTAAYQTPEISFWETLLCAGDGPTLVRQIEQHLREHAAVLTQAAMLSFRQDIAQMVYTYLKQQQIHAHRLFGDKESNRLYLAAPCSIEDMLAYCRLLVTRSIEYTNFFESKASVVDTVRSYLDVHFSENLQRSDLAGIVYVSPDYLSRLFKKETGRSLMQYITNKRIEAACRLLSESSLPINAVAMQVGFQSFAYFSKVFREAKGITPITWRKKHQIK